MPTSTKLTHSALKVFQKKKKKYTDMSLKITDNAATAFSVALFIELVVSTYNLLF